MSQSVSEEEGEEIRKTRRCTDIRLHAGIVFLSSISMQDKERKKNKKNHTLVFHWLLTVARRWHPGVFIGWYEVCEMIQRVTFTWEVNLGSTVH